MGDFGRSEDQGRLMIAALQQFQDEFRKDPAKLFTWVGAGMRNARTDIPLDELMTLAFTGANLNAKHVTNVVLPGTSGFVGNISVVNLDQAKMFVQNVAKERMWNYHWAPGTMNPRAVIKGFQMMGVDTSPWGE